MAVELDVVANIARALGMTAPELLAPLFLPTPERSKADAVWADAMLRTVEDEARSFGKELDNPHGLAAIAAVSVIARAAPQELPVIVALLKSRASDLELSLADRFRGLQGEADRRAVQAKRISATRRRRTR